MAKRPKQALLSKSSELRRLVAAKWREDWSPEQIAGWLATRYAPDSEMRVSHETIYRTLYLRTKGSLHRQLLERLLTKRKMRKGKRSTTDGQKRGRIVDAISIHERPAEIGTRVKLGHWCPPEGGSVPTSAKVSCGWTTSDPLIEIPSSRKVRRHP